MTPDNLLDYAFGQLDESGRLAAERAFADDPSLASSADRLGRSIHRLVDDGDLHEPPTGLASRTVAFVADRTSRRAILDFVPARVPFRWADVGVAAAVLIAGLLTLVPAVNASRNQAAQAGCAFNLQRLGVSLANYASAHDDHYPDVCTKGPNCPVGTYAMVLHGENFLTDPRTLHCPCSDECEAIETPRPDPRHIDYAYNVGSRPHWQGAVEPIHLSLSHTIPLLADQPAHDDRTVLPGNSPNHGFRGQNVLFSDLHVEWFPTRRVKLDRDLFLNDENRPEPGIGPLDSALVPAAFQVGPR